MKFAIFREIEGTRKFLVEWDQEQIEDALVEEFDVVDKYAIRRAFRNVIEKFKKESIKIP